MKKFNDMDSKRPLIYLVLVLIGIAVLGFAFTYAVLLDRENKPNEFKISNNEVEIEEDVTYPKKLIPGSTIYKNPSIKNTGNEPVYVRVRVLFSDSDAEALCEPLVINNNWVYQNGWYYYRNSLSVGATTPAIFTFIKIKDSISEADIINFEVIIYAESFNSVHYNSYLDIIDISEVNP